MNAEQLLLGITVFGIVILIGFWLYTAQSKNPELELGRILTMQIRNKPVTTLMLISIILLAADAGIAASITPSSGIHQVNLMVRLLGHVTLMLVCYVSMIYLPVFFSLASSAVKARSFKKGISSVLGAIVFLLAALGIPLINVWIAAHTAHQTQLMSMAWWHLWASHTEQLTVYTSLGIPNPAIYSPIDELNSGIALIAAMYPVHWVLSVMLALLDVAQESPAKKDTKPEKSEKPEKIAADVPPSHDAKTPVAKPAPTDYMEKTLIEMIEFVTEPGTHRDLYVKRAVAAYKATIADIDKQAQLGELFGPIKLELAAAKATSGTAAMKNEVAERIFKAFAGSTTGAGGNMGLGITMSRKGYKIKN